MIARDLAWIDVRPEAMEAWNRRLQRELGRAGAGPAPGTAVAAAAKALASPKMRETMEMGGHTPIGSTPTEFRKYLEGYLKEMASLAKETGVKPL